MNWKEFQEPGLLTETAPGEADLSVPNGFEGDGNDDDVCDATKLKSTQLTEYRDSSRSLIISAN